MLNPEGIKLPSLIYQELPPLMVNPYTPPGERHRYINRLIDAEVEKHRRQRKGRASAVPWSTLKRLAALRLHRAAFNYAEAQDVIKEWQAAMPHPEDAHDVLPTYGDDSAWLKAVRKAEREVEALSRPSSAE